MPNQNNNIQCQIGMIGLGMVDHGFTVAGYDKDTTKVEQLSLAASKDKVCASTDMKDFVNSLQTPRAIILLVPAGRPVDLVIHELLNYIEPGDLIIDAGNSHFTDTDIRTQDLQEKNINFLGVGISGGEEGARRGPSIMPGGSKASYEKVRLIFEAIAAKVKGDPCVTYLGNGSAGHYVKMVHNGIEYGIMQLIAETYDLMKRGLGLNNTQLRDVYSAWNDSELNSYLIEITSKIFAKNDEDTHRPLIDEILGVAKQNGTGMWTSESAMELQLPVPAIDVAVSMRDMSVLVQEREQANALYHRPIKMLEVEPQAFIEQLKCALFSAMMIVYAQGMSLLSVASVKYNYELDLEAVARIWRGGCIIRSALLEDIRAAYRANKKLANMLLDPGLSQQLLKHQKHLRLVVSQACVSGVPVPTLMSALSYLDAYRSDWTPANLIQAQRDYFGSHTYQRSDKKGVFHTEWEKDNT
jgi:6-phosphogluconate dehydrogenase